MSLYCRGRCHEGILTVSVFFRREHAAADMAAIPSWSDAPPIGRRDHGWCTDRLTDDYRYRSFDVGILHGSSWRTDHVGDCHSGVPTDALLWMMDKQNSQPLLDRPSCVDGVHPAWGGRGNDVVFVTIVLTYGFVERHWRGREASHEWRNDATKVRGYLVPRGLKIGRIRIRRWWIQPSERMKLRSCSD